MAARTPLIFILFYNLWSRFDLSCCLSRIFLLRCLFHVSPILLVACLLPSLIWCLARFRPLYAALFYLFPWSSLAIHIHSSFVAACFVFSLSGGLIFPFPILGFLLKTKVLSLACGVHFDVVNYVYRSLQSHVDQFHYFWRDYSILLPLFMIFYIGLLACCGIAIVYIYRHLLFVLVIPLPLPWIFLVLFLRAPFHNNYYTGPTRASFLHHKIYSSFWGRDAMTCSHDIHLVRQCVLSVLCFVLLHHVLHFLILYLSLFLTSLVRLILLKEKEHYQYIMISRRRSL